MVLALRFEGWLGLCLIRKVREVRGKCLFCVVVGRCKSSFVYVCCLDFSFEDYMCDKVFLFCYIDLV